MFVEWNRIIWSFFIRCSYCTPRTSVIKRDEVGLDAFILRTCRVPRIRGPAARGRQERLHKVDSGAVTEAWKAFPQLGGAEGESISSGLKTASKGLKVRQQRVSVLIMGSPLERQCHVLELAQVLKPVISLPAVWPWASPLNSLGLSCLISKIGTIIPCRVVLRI